MTMAIMYLMPESDIFRMKTNDKLDYLNVPDVYMNNVLSSMRPNSSTLCIINFYSHGTSYSSKDASTAQSKIKFIRMENSSGIDINQPDEPFNLIENRTERWLLMSLVTLILSMPILI